MSRFADRVATSKQKRIDSLEAALEHLIDAVEEYHTTLSEFPLANMKLYDKEWRSLQDVIASAKRTLNDVD